MVSLDDVKILYILLGMVMHRGGPKPLNIEEQASSFLEY